MDVIDEATPSVHEDVESRTPSDITSDGANGKPLGRGSLASYNSNYTPDTNAAILASGIYPSEDVHGSFTHNNFQLETIGE